LDPKFRSIVRTARPWFFAWVLNVLVFVPGYVFSRPQARFFPDITLAHASFAHGFVRPLMSFVLRRNNQDVWRISLDVVVLVLLAVAFAGTRWRAPTRGLLVGLYVSLLAFLGYHYSVAIFFDRPPALGEDWHLLLNLFHFLGAVMSPLWAAIVAAVALGLVGVTLMAAHTFRIIQHATGAWSVRRRAVLALGMLAPCAVVLVWLGVSRDTPFVQINTKRMLYNWRNSQAEGVRMAVLKEPVPDRRNDAFLQLRLATRPNFHLMMVEAYGEVLATSDAAPAYRALMQRVAEQLARAGFYARTAYSTSPVHGGTSWFAISTVHTGTLIDSGVPYNMLQFAGPKVPSLTRYFAANGYHTYTLQPGSNDHAGLKRVDIYNYDVLVDAVNLRYPGFAYGWGIMPDQWAWWQFMHRDGWFKQPGQPYFLYSMCVSTHWRWQRVPPYVHDVHAFEQQDKYVEPPHDPTWPPIPEAANIATELRRNYFKSIEYEWRVMLDVLEAEKSDDVVIAILGDHQPGLEPDVPGGVNKNTPLHMISRDPEFIESFAQAGFQPGMYAKPGVVEPLSHAGLFSLWVSMLEQRYGVPGTPKVPIYPGGIRLSTISR
jgi:hypothetical protein